MIATVTSRRTRRLALAALALPMALAACSVPPGGNPPTPFSITITSADPLVLTSSSSTTYAGTIKARIEGDGLGTVANVDVDDLPAGFTVDQRSTSCSSSPAGDICNVSARVTGPKAGLVSGTEYDVELTGLADGLPVSADTTIKIP